MTLIEWMFLGSSVVFWGGVVGAQWVLHRRQNRDRAREALKAMAAADEDLERVCENCAHWGWKAGQVALASHPPFREVMRNLTPAQVCTTHREFTPNEEYLALREELGKALEAGDDQRVADLQSRLDVMNPKRVDEAALDYQDIDWDDFGLCHKKKLVVVGRDTCDEWEPASERTRQKNKEDRELRAS